VIGASIDPALLTGEVRLLGEQGPIDASELELEVALESEDALELMLTFAGATLWRGLQMPHGYITELENNGLRTVLGATGEVVQPTRVFQDWPLAVYLADGAMVLGDVLIPLRATVGPLPPDLLRSDAWADVDIQTEIGETGAIQARTAELAARSARWVLTDHGSGELADLVALAVEPLTVTVRLYHCKRSGAATPGRRVDDLYDVIGQAVKSIPWTLAPAGVWAELLRRLDQRDACRLLHGEEQALRAWLGQLASSLTLGVRFEVIAVQPGVSVADVATWEVGRALLHAAAGWCASESASFMLLGSE
jgi:hypothetical protein